MQHEDVGAFDTQIEGTYIRAAMQALALLWKIYSSLFSIG